jgi:DNA (cytosine-5)-methyltransferase 1
VVGDLAALGYDARWTVTQAVEVGAIHSRERWWCLARRREWRQPAFSFANTHRESIRVESIRVESEREQCEPPQRGNVVAAIPPGAVGDNLAHTDCSRQSGHSSKHDHNGSEPHRDNANGQIAATYWETESPPEPTLQFMDDGLSSRLASLRAIGNSIVPQQARRAFRVLIGLDPALPHSAKATRNPRRTA